MAVRHPMDDLDAAGGRPVTPRVTCESCGQTVARKGYALRCRECGEVLTRDSDLAERAKPDELLPFTVSEHDARQEFLRWLGSGPLTPRALKRLEQPASIDGVFLPFWVFSANTSTQYAGQRRERNPQTDDGTEHFTDWHGAYGRVEVTVTDELVAACSPLPSGIGGWPLEHAVPYTRGATADRRIIAYDIEPETAFTEAGQVIRQRVDSAVREDIGGEKQRVSILEIEYSDAAYGLLLLPAWLLTYRHRDRTYSALVNGSTGETSGERPLSRTRISLVAAVLLAVVVTGMVALFF